MTRLALLSVLLAACSSHEPTPPPATAHTNDYAQAHVLRTYQVPPGQEKRAERLLREISYPVTVVSAQGAQTQFVHLGPQVTGDGFFVLSAPAGIHEGVKELLDKLKTVPAPHAPQSIQTTCWIVLGWPAKDASIPFELNEIDPTLKKLGVLGPMRFELLDSVQATALDGEQASAQGHSLDSFKETASSDGERIELRLDIRIQGGAEKTGLETTVAINPGQTAVLGQAGYVPAQASLQQANQRATLFYIVRARSI